MKIKELHYRHLLEKLAPLDTLENREKYARRDFPRADRCKDVNKRYRWDLWYQAGLSRFACDELYDYMNDDHIDTALRNIVATVE